MGSFVCRGGNHANDRSCLNRARRDVVDVLDQFGLGIGRPRDENRTGVCDRLRDSLKEGVILPLQLLRAARAAFSKG
jgi:hypothetical protein